MQKNKVLENKLLEIKVSIQLNKNKTTPQLMIPHDEELTRGRQGATQ